MGSDITSCKGRKEKKLKRIEVSRNNFEITETEGCMGVDEIFRMHFAILTLVCIAIKCHREENLMHINISFDTHTKHPSFNKKKWEYEC